MSQSRCEVVEFLKKIISDASVYELRFWLHHFLAGNNTGPLLIPSRDAETRGDWLTDYLRDLPPEMKTKIVDADTILLAELDETAEDFGVDYASDVILLLEEAPVTYVERVLMLLESVEEDPVLGSMRWRGGGSLKEYAQRAREAQEHFRAQSRS